MMEQFLDKMRQGGKTRVVSSQDSHKLSLMTLSAVVTRECQVGVLMQDKASGKSWFIEVDGKLDEVNDFNRKLQDCLDDAMNCHYLLQDVIKAKMAQN